jgi:hypothetical protein
VVIAVLVGLSVATQTSFNAAPQRALGPAAFITISVSPPERSGS